MNGVMMPGVSAGSNQVGASETWMPQVSCPSGSAAKLERGAPATRPSAANPRTSRRVKLVWLTPDLRLTDEFIVSFPIKTNGWLRVFSQRDCFVAPLLAMTDVSHVIASEAKQSLRALDRDVLEGGGVGEIGDQAEPGLADPRSHTIDEAELPDRRVDRPLGHDLLHLVEDCCELLVVELGRLLLVELIDVGVAAIDIGAALDDKGLQPGRGVAERAAAAEDQVFELLVRIGLNNGRPFERPELEPDPHRLEIVEHRLGDIRIGRVAVELAAVEAVEMPRLGQQVFGLDRIVNRQRRLPEEVEREGDDAAGDLRVAERDRFVHALAVDRQASGAAHALVVPWRFRVPLVGEIDPLRRRRDDRLEGQPRRALQLFGELTADRVDDVDLAALQCRQPRRLFGDRLEHQALDARGLAPIALEGLEH